MANEGDLFLREIEEEVRRERLTQLWNKYGVAVIAGLTAIIVIYIGWKWYENSKLTAAANAGAQFTEVTQLIGNGKNDDAMRGFEQIAQEGTFGHALLAELQLAANARKDGKLEDALEHYNKIFSDASADNLIRSFAKLQIASLSLDKDDLITTKNRLDDLLQEDSPWKYAAREILGLAAYKAGKFEEAQEAFTQLLASNDTPRSLRQRAQLVMALASRKNAPSGTATKATTTDDQQQSDSRKAEKTGEAETQ